MNHDVFYFGCWSGPGHYLWQPNGHYAWQAERGDLPWSNLALDGDLCGDPRLADHARPSHWRADEKHRPQLVARFHRRDGWAALAFWDRTVDCRYHSNSVFLVRGAITPAETLARFAEAFPGIAKRCEGLVLP